MDQRQGKAPLFDVLVHHRNTARVNGHVPGHKQGQAFDLQGMNFYRDILDLDLTEVGDLDDLHEPSGAIQEAQELASELFGAEKTHFLVGGSTVGNMALVCGVCKPGDRLIIQRNSHQSIFNACRLARVQPIYWSGCQIGEDLPFILDPRDLYQALKLYPDTKAVFITSPGYYGEVQPIADIAKICHEKGIPLLVDEAHGAHFGFHPDLPLSALAQGADGVVQSTHKMLPAMTMSSMLHLQGKRVRRDRVHQWLTLLQSSSPSYPLMASLDLARRYMASSGADRLDALLKEMVLVRKKIKGLSMLEEPDIKIRDPLKMILRSHSGISGFQLLDWFQGRNIFLEMADHRNCLASFSVGTMDEDLEYVYEAMKSLDQELISWSSRPSLSSPLLPRISESLFPFDMEEKNVKQSVPLVEAVARRSAGLVVPYPPGIPLWLPGELITGESVEYLHNLLELGGRVRGMASSFPPQVYVIQ
ncbi:aminotransferase class V-fold PLP-dependent enzyme [Kroppenstedtia pulmonis]|uniref:Aminotransferase class V-fold PLP-dependent enzyme n=1 Tax=Kroppenstedtia pulmonis TaxID=1380685 RepID=A0A7D4CJJ9_9BACL|nr:aminotransferase class I/II-fold pyridoxal phosphate-dependent enzyme [Kroppenstedtia pulmonis]QKG83058.1 aminotransferase class V-fold PLP-dependent enzyme [Kroppenstedtia pulmonis]